MNGFLCDKSKKIREESTADYADTVDRKKIRNRGFPQKRARKDAVGNARCSLVRNICLSNQSTHLRNQRSFQRVQRFLEFLYLFPRIPEIPYVLQSWVTLDIAEREIRKPRISAEKSAEGRSRKCEMQPRTKPSVTRFKPYENRKHQKANDFFYGSLT